MEMQAAPVALAPLSLSILAFLRRARPARTCGQVWPWRAWAQMFRLPLLTTRRALGWVMQGRIARRLEGADPARTRIAQFPSAVSPTPYVATAAIRRAIRLPQRITPGHVAQDVSGPESVPVLRHAAR